MQTFLNDDGVVFHPTGLVLTLHGRYAVPVENIEQAAHLMLDYRDKASLTESRYYSIFAGRIFDQNRRQVARIHYDGDVEVWNNAR